MRLLVLAGLILAGCTAQTRRSALVMFAPLCGAVAVADVGLEASGEGSSDVDTALLVGSGVACIAAGVLVVAGAVGRPESHPESDIGTTEAASAPNASF